MPTSPDALAPDAPSGGDAFLERIAPDGSLSYLTYIGGSGWDVAKGISLDPGGNIYVTGTTQSRDFPTTPGAFDRLCGIDGTCRNNEPTDTAVYDDSFVLKLAPGGRSIVYSTYRRAR
jgi:beta-propeller repeat-containing protein